MNYIYKITGDKAELINTTEQFDEVIAQDSFPDREYHDDAHAILSYNETDGIHWEYVPFTPAELRENAYKIEKRVEWEDELISVDQANDMWVKYNAEGNDKAEELTALIAVAKAEIRDRYPNEESE